MKPRSHRDAGISRGERIAILLITWNHLKRYKEWIHSLIYIGFMEGVDVKRNLVIHNLKRYLGSVISGNSFRQQNIPRKHGDQSSLASPMRRMAISMIIWYHTVTPFQSFPSNCIHKNLSRVVWTALLLKEMGGRLWSGKLGGVSAGEGTTAAWV